MFYFGQQILRKFGYASLRKVEEQTYVKTAITQKPYQRAPKIGSPANVMKFSFLANWRS